MDDRTARALNAINHSFYSEHAADFDAGRLVTVRGWLVSLTEARLCALAALAELPEATRPAS